MVPMPLIELWGLKPAEPQGGRGRLELRNKQMNSTSPKTLELLNREFEYHCNALPVLCLDGEGIPDWCMLVLSRYFSEVVEI